MLSAALSEDNEEVVKIDLYTSVPNKQNIQDVKIEMIEHQQIDALTFFKFVGSTLLF